MTIDEPVVDGWTDPSQPVIKGHASDDIALDKLWLTIKDETANRYWSGIEWVAGGALIYISGVSDKKVTGWEYTGLSKDDLRSGDFTIRAYVKDKAGRIGSVEAASPYKKRYYLGKKDFTAFGINVTTVVNDGWKTVPNSFTTLPLENSIYVESHILPARVAPYLNGSVKWTVQGLNTPSGTPSEPVWGNPSRFKVVVPPVPAYSAGRGVAMGYGVYARVEQESGSVGSSRKDIYQDDIDQCRQEYVDMNKATKPDRPVFVADPNMSSPYNQGVLPCGAYFILPSRIATFEALDNDVPFYIAVTWDGGYRNPRRNFAAGGVRNSVHLYGDGLDIVPVSRNGAEMQALWIAAPLPKLLERGAIPLDANDTTDVYPTSKGNGIPDVFERDSRWREIGGADHIHLGN